MGNAFGGRAGAAVGGENEEVRYEGAGAGLYFGDHFVMGGQEFAALEPEAFLFGEMADLNYLSRMPGVMHRHPPNIKHTNATRCLFFTNKETVRLVPHATGGDDIDRHAKMHLDFTFDADAPCSVTVHFLAKEVVDANGVVQFESKFSTPTFRYGEGIGQLYSHPEATIERLDKYADDELFFQQGSDTYPMVIHIVAHVDGPRQALATYATFEKSAAGALTVRPLVQKANVNGLCLVLKEIFGIEKKETNRDAAGEEFDDDEDNTECVVCMSQAKDTMALPCRHLCLCNPCADVLRFQSSKCPICRAPFHSLLQIRVLKPEDEIQRDPDGLDDDEDEDAAADLPPGYKSVSLAEAVVGSDTTSAAPSPARAGPGGSDGYIQVERMDAGAGKGVPAPAIAFSGPSPDPPASMPSMSPGSSASSGKGKGKLIVDDEQYLDVDGANYDADADAASSAAVPQQGGGTGGQAMGGTQGGAGDDQPSSSPSEQAGGQEPFPLPGQAPAGRSLYLPQTPPAASPVGGVPAEEYPLMSGPGAEGSGGSLEI